MLKNLGAVDGNWSCGDIHIYIDISLYIERDIYKWSEYMIEEKD